MTMITAQRAMEQTEFTVEFYFHNAVKMLDDQFGEGYAKVHSELVGTLVSAMAQDFATCAYTHRKEWPDA